MRGERLALSGACKKKLPDIAYELAEIDTYLAVVYQDVSTPKYAPCQADIPRIKALQASTAALFQIAQYLAANAQTLGTSSAVFLAPCLSQLGALADYGRGVLSGGPVSWHGSLTAAFDVERASLAQLSLLALLVRYQRQAQALTALCPVREELAP